MAHSTKVKSSDVISEIRDLRSQGVPIKAIARLLRFSTNTVRKIVRRVGGYEGATFTGEWGGRPHYAAPVVSEIDGSPLHIQSNVGTEYPRVSKDGERFAVHAYLARRVLDLIGVKWCRGFVVHHVDGNRWNFALSNLVLFPWHGHHHAHHKRMELAMYCFLRDRKLLDAFYADYPDLNVPTLRDWFDHRESIRADVDRCRKQSEVAS
jgi:hypothetical protein